MLITAAVVEDVPEQLAGRQFRVSAGKVESDQDSEPVESTGPGETTGPVETLVAAVDERDTTDADGHEEEDR